MNLKRVSINIKGRVQGVAFRFYTKKKADKLGLKGNVRNLGDKSVQLIVVGKQEDIELMVAWCYRGSPASRVDEVMVESMDIEFEDRSGFQIIR